MILLAVIAGKWLLCLWSGLGLVVLLLWLKGKQFGVNTEKVGRFLSHPAAAKGGAVCNRHLSDRRAALVRHQLLCPEMGGLSAQPFNCGRAVCGRSLDYRVPVAHKKRDYVLKRYQEIPQTILERRNGENKMDGQIVLREYQTSDHPALIGIIRGDVAV